jgi:hypothetical protein
MTVYIDARAGSEELILHPPFCYCLDCGKKHIITLSKKGSITSSVCPSSPSSHSSLASLVNLSRMVGRSDTNNSSSSADVYFSGNGPTGDISIGIELKKISDWIESLKTGRLVGTQISAMLETFDVVWILVYGPCRPNTDINSPTYGSLQVPHGYRLNQWRDYRVGKRKSPVPYSYGERFFASPSLTMESLRDEKGREAIRPSKIRAYRVADIQEAAWWIGECLYPVWQKKWTDHSSFRVFDDTTSDFKQRIAVRPGEVTLTEEEKGIATIAAKLPGVGFERAIAVAKHFNSVEEMVLADVDEWAEIKVQRPGKRMVRIGPVRAKEIVRFLKRKAR